MNTDKIEGSLSSISQSLNFLCLVATICVPFYIISLLISWECISCTPAPIAPVVEPWEGDLPPQGEIGAPGAIGAAK